MKTNFEAKGIKWEPSVPYAPDQNGTSEVANRVMGKVQAVLHDGDLLQFLWAKILKAVIYLYNQSPIRRLRVQNITLFEAWTGEIPDLSHLRILGCVAWHHVPKEIRNKSATSKLEDRSIRCQLVRYKDSNQYRLWDQRARKIVRACNVIFDETAMRQMPFKDHGFFYDDADYEDDNNEEIRNETSSTFYSPDVPSTTSHRKVDQLKPVERARIENVTDYDPMDEADNIITAPHDKILLLKDVPKSDISQTRGDELVLHGNNDRDQSHTALDSTYTPRPTRIRQKTRKLIENESYENEFLPGNSMDTAPVNAAITFADNQSHREPSNPENSKAGYSQKSENTIVSEALYCFYASVYTGVEHDFDPLYDFATLPWNMALALNPSVISDILLESAAIVDPRIYEAAKASPQHCDWEAAIEKKLWVYKKMNTWTVIPRRSVPR